MKEERMFISIEGRNILVGLWEPIQSNGRWNVTEYDGKFPYNKGSYHIASGNTKFDAINSASCYLNMKYGQVIDA